MLASKEGASNAGGSAGDAATHRQSITSNQGVKTGGLNMNMSSMNMNMKDMNNNIMSTLNIVHKNVKNSTRLYNLNLAETFSTTLTKAVNFANPVTNSSPKVIPYVTFLWACRLIVSLCKSQRIKLQLQDNYVLDQVNTIIKISNEQVGVSGAAQQDYREVLEWAQMAKDVLTNTDIRID